MVNMNYIMTLMMFLIMNLIFTMYRKHLLIMLLVLEYLIMSLYIIMFLYLNFFNMEMYLLNIYLIFSVCESTLGLSILIFLIRTHGNDHMMIFNLY